MRFSSSNSVHEYTFPLVVCVHVHVSTIVLMRSSMLLLLLLFVLFSHTMWLQRQKISLCVHVYAPELNLPLRHISQPLFQRQFLLNPTAEIVFPDKFIIILYSTHPPYHLNLLSISRSVYYANKCKIVLLRLLLRFP